VELRAYECKDFPPTLSLAAYTWTILKCQSHAWLS